MPPAIENSNSARTGVVLVGHGTRSELGRRQCQTLADEIAAGLDQRFYAAELAYLELASPTIDEGVARLVKQQVERMIVAPLLLFSAGHAKEDIPSAVRSALAVAGKPDLPLVQTEPLGWQEPMIELAAVRFHEAADCSVPPAETCLLFIGRGSRDSAAIADMQKFGELLHRRLGIGAMQVGFLAMASPVAAETIQEGSNSSYRQIVVQPHLLFHGELLDRLQQNLSAAAAAAASPEKCWRISRVLGDESLPLAHILLQAILTAGNNRSGPASVATEHFASHGDGKR